MQTTFYVPIGLPTSDVAPVSAPRVGYAYYDTVRMELMVWSGSEWIPVSQPAQVTAGAGLSGTMDANGIVTLNVGSGPGIAAETDRLTTRITPDAGLSYDGTSALVVDTLWLDERIRAVAVTEDTDLFIRKSGDTMSGNLSLPAGLSSNHAINKSQLDAMGLKLVTAGNGLTGGGAVQGNPILNVGAGQGITVAADSVAVDYGALDDRYSQDGHTHTPTQVGFRMGRNAVGHMEGQTTKTITISHGLGKTPTIALGTIHRDGGEQTGTCSVDTMSSTSVVWKIFNHVVSAISTYELAWLVA